MTTLTTTKATLDVIANRSEENRKRLEQAKTIIGTAAADLAVMVSAYAGFVSQLDIDAGGNAGNVAWDVAKAEKDIIQAEFLALKTRAEALQAVVAGL